jgi:FtsH-binding integral membrane protein
MANQSGQFFTDGDVVARENSAFMTKVYQWMSLGVLVTGLVASVIGTNESLMQTIMLNRALFWVVIIAQFGLVLSISGLINRMSVLTATSLFILYSALTGVTFSVIFAIYTATSIQSAFFTTAIGFGGLTAFGYFTKKDLGPVGSFCMMGLFGMIGFSLLSLFIPSMMGGAAGLVYSMIGLLVFAGLTAYDTQKIKMLGRQTTTEVDKGRATILGALTLYLDFINLFMIILRLTGDRRR